MYYIIIIIYFTLSIGSSLTNALEAYEKKQMDIALTILDELINENTDDHESYYLSAKIYYSIGDLDNSNTNILKAIDIKKDDENYRDFQKKLETLKNNIKSAQKTFDIGDTKGSISEYNDIIEKFSDSPVPHYNLATVHKNLIDYQLAVENFNKALLINPYNQEKYLKAIRGIAQRLAKLGKDKYKIREYDEALKLYLEAVEYYPGYVSTLFRICMTYYKVSDYEKAKEFAEKTLFYDDINYQAMKILGDLHYRLGDLENSIDSYKKSISINKEYHQAYYSLAKALDSKGSVDEAIASLLEAININPKYDKAYVLLGRIYFDRSNYDNAINNYKKAIKLDKKNYSYYWRLAESYNATEQYLLAKELAKTSLKIKNNYANAFYELGYAELYLCNGVAAKDAFEKARKDRTFRELAEYYLEHPGKASHCK